MSQELQLDIAGIMSRLPHRYPFLLVDRVLPLKMSPLMNRFSKVIFLICR